MKSFTIVLAMLSGYTISLTEIVVRSGHAAVAVQGTLVSIMFLGFSILFISGLTYK